MCIEIVTNMETSREALRLTDEEDQPGKDVALDAELWGKLQEHLPLRVIYDKLSQEELCRLRLVCKDWNHGALQRLVPEPYFVTITSGYHFKEDGSFLNGIVTYDVASGHGSFKHQRSRLPELASHVPPFEVEGLILCHTRGRGDLQKRGVFNVHTLTWHVIPQSPEPSYFHPACGLMVDTFERPYTFKLIEGNAFVNTQIYDSKSRSWSTTSSRLMQEAHFTVNSPANLNDSSYSCICNNGRVYIAIGTTLIIVYSMEEDMWTTLDFPLWLPDGRPSNNLDSDTGEHSALGVWEGRIFTTTEDCFEKRVTVWELVDPLTEQKKWVEYARMSKKQYRWLYQTNSVSHSTTLTRRAEMRLLSFFSKGYLLICCWQWCYARAEALVLFNVTNMKWKKVDLPMGVVATYDSDSDEEESRLPWCDSDESDEESEASPEEEDSGPSDSDSAEEAEDFDTEGW